MAIDKGKLKIVWYLQPAMEFSLVSRKQGSEQHLFSFSKVKTMEYILWLNFQQ